MCVRACIRARACVRGCARACVCVREHGRVRDMRLTARKIRHRSGTHVDQQHEGKHVSRGDRQTERERERARERASERESASSLMSLRL